MHLSRYAKDSILTDFSKFSKIMHHYAFFCNYANYAFRAELCDLHPCIIPEALYLDVGKKKIIIIIIILNTHVHVFCPVL